MKICSIRSSSRGNAILVYTKDTVLLVDCGISGKEAENGICQIGLSPENISAILVTHEHHDHISGVGVMSRRYGLPVYANTLTWQAMESKLGKISTDFKKTFNHIDNFEIGDIKVQPFSISHDAADPVGYSFSNEKKKISIATDTGILEEGLFRAIYGSETVLLESNHDKNMLDIGAYPLPLKQRIKSNKGHLSNDDAGKAAEFLVRMGTKNIILGHLSPDNNYPLLAKQTVMNSLIEAGIDPQKDVQLHIAPSDCIGCIL